MWLYLIVCKYRHDKHWISPKIRVILITQYSCVGCVTQRQGIRCNSIYENICAPGFIKINNARITQRYVKHGMRLCKVRFGSLLA